MINSSKINPKTFAQYEHQITDNQYTKEELNLPGHDLVTEQIKDKELLKLIKKKRITKWPGLSSSH